VGTRIRARVVCLAGSDGGKGWEADNQFVMFGCDRGHTHRFGTDYLLDDWQAVSSCFAAASASASKNVTAFQGRRNCFCLDGGWGGEAHVCQCTQNASIDKMGECGEGGLFVEHGWRKSGAASAAMSGSDQVQVCNLCALFIRVCPHSHPIQLQKTVFKIHLPRLQCSVLLSVLLSFQSVPHLPHQPPCLTVVQGPFELLRIFLQKRA
jgi:hypothetical protein